MTMLPPGSTIGILGGGQLGRMIALAAAEIGMHAHIYAPEKESPAFEVAGRHTVAAYDDGAALVAFAGAVDVVTYEFENIPAQTATLISAHAPLRPGAQALAITQDRLAEKTFVAGLGIGTAPFRAVGDGTDLESALRDLGRPAVLKTRRFGYDGKGQAIIRAEDDPAAALAGLGRAPAILEGFVPFLREISVVAARGQDGSFVAYELCENRHRHHILDVTSVPAHVSPEARAQALDAARRIAAALDYVGVLAVELFVIADGSGESVLVNEIAPRVHNSGHWTIEGARTSQFAQHVRAVCGWPLGPAGMTGAQATMTNLIGDDAGLWARIAAEPGASLHLYGKREARPGRKMGHVTRVTPA
ncbi:MAG: 5-(carboxyamino)imidazole ribonucleotide synthase [Pseudochelatococcus sp.]|jgi:5-(carboxyamino)imidazole ribonucleotide synthase|uniref:5-(carboxyamino)imidazole ribonucleotide synthase n=1 Tax=Pseudochelatococcus sp. TaxID=2020869 RepID=UPI003D943775